MFKYFIEAPRGILFFFVYRSLCNQGSKQVLLGRVVKQGSKKQSTDFLRIFSKIELTVV